MVDRFHLADVEQMIRLLADAGDPTIDMPLTDRKRMLCAGLARLIDADFWDWSMFRLSSEVPYIVEPIRLIDGDFREQVESPENSQLVADEVPPDSKRPQIKYLTQLDTTVLSAIQSLLSQPNTDQFGQTCFANGSPQVLASVFPSSHEIYSVIRLQRRGARTAFSERERMIVHVLFQQVDWLHRDGGEVETREVSVELTPRERQIVNLLLNGESRDSIAAQLGLSRYTINAYFRDIYRHFGVSARTELMARFIRGRE